MNSHAAIFEIALDNEQVSAVNTNKKDILNLSGVDKCLISMEELEIDIKNLIHIRMKEAEAKKGEEYEQDEDSSKQHNSSS